MNNKSYTSPEYEVEIFEINDVITTSGGTTDVTSTTSLEPGGNGEF